MSLSLQSETDVFFFWLYHSVFNPNILVVGGCIRPGLHSLQIIIIILGGSSHLKNRMNHQVIIPYFEWFTLVWHTSLT